MTASLSVAARDRLNTFRAIRYALNIGLGNSDEVNRLKGMCSIYDELGTAYPKGLKPLAATDSDDAMHCFAEALRQIDLLELELPPTESCTL